MSEETEMGDDETKACPAEVDVGVRPTAFQTWQSTRVNFHGFEALSTTKGASVASPEFTCLGHRWFVDIFPGGEVNTDDGVVSIYLNSRSDERVEINCFFIVRDSADRVAKKWLLATSIFFPGHGGDNWGCDNFAPRPALLKALIEGTLVLEVRMKHHVRPNALSVPFIPENPLRNNIDDIFMDEDSADIVFEVSEQGVTKCRKRAKTAPTKFHAHSFVLQRSGSLLADLCKPGPGGKGAKATPIPISGMKPDIFKFMLSYLYGGDPYYKEELDANAWKDLIDAADKYNVVQMKLVAEVRYAQLTALTTENALENLLYADSKNLALLKEAVMDFIVENGDEVMEKVSFEDVPGSVVKDLWAAVNRGKEKESNGSSCDKNYSTMRVSGLRELLDKKGLDVDGSREAMIARLKENDEKGDVSGADAAAED